MPVPSNQSGPMFANKKQYTATEIRNNFIAVNEELKKNGYTYFIAESPGITQIFSNGKNIPYYPDYAQYTVVAGPKGNITDYKNPNFDEALLRKFADAKSLNDAYQHRVSAEIRGAMASAVDPSRVDVVSATATVDARLNNSQGGPGIRLDDNRSGQMTVSYQLRDVLRNKNIDFNNLTPAQEAAINGAMGAGDVDGILTLRKTWGAQPAAPDTGLDPRSDEFQYLSRKKSTESAEGSTGGAYMSTVAENEAALKTAWADFKAVNDELKAKGYTYMEASDGVYGTALEQSSRSYADSLKKVEGPKGDLNRMFAKYEDGRYATPEADPNSPQFDKGLTELHNKASKVGGIWSIMGFSGGVARAQELKDIEDRLVAKGVDLVKLEQDNPKGVLAGTNNQVVTYGAKAPTGQTNLERASELANQNSAMPMSAGNNTAPDYGTDEYKYLQAKQESQHVGFSSPKIEDTTAGLAGAWAQFKADNEKLKAEGYDYQEVKPGFYGKPVVSTDSFLTRVSGPKGDIVGVTGSLSSELKDIRVRAKGPASLYDASQQYSADQKVDELSKALIAKGVDIAKLEQDNPQGAMASTSDRWSDFIATHPGTTPEQLQGMLAINYLTIKSMDDRTPEQRVDDAWSDYKASNEKLKAAGYSYDPILDDSKMEPGVLVSGPKGMIWDKPGFSLQLDEASQDKSNPDFKLSSDHFVAQSNLASTKYSLDMYNDISSRLSADGVNLTQLENENPNFYRNSLSNTTGKDIFNSSSLGSLVNSEDTEIMGANAAKNILGAPDRQRGGGAGGNLMQANAANPGVPATGIYIDQFIDPIQAQTNAMNAGTWKPSDGYYFSSPNGVGFDPTGMMADNRITNPEKYKLATADADGIPDKDGYVRIFGTQVGDNKWLKDNGYDYQDVFAEGMPDVRGPKGAFNLGWTTDPAKKGDAQKMEEEAWAKAGVTFAGQTLEGQEWTNNATKILADPWNHPKNKPGLVDTSWLKPNGMTFEQALAAHAALVNTTTGEPKPGVTPAMLSKALVDLRLAGAFEGGGFGTAGLRIEDGMIISGGQLPNAQNSLPSPEWLKSMGYSPGYYYKKPDPQGLGGEYDTQLGADGQIWTAVPPSVLAAMPTTQPALQSATVPAMSAGVVASSVTQTEPANPDYNPALVHAELNPTGSIQKQMELNAYFHSPNPDIQESLKSELNPTGSLKMQADLNNFFANVAPTTNQAPTTAVPSYSIPAPAPATTVPAPSVEATAPIPSISQYSQSVQDQTAAQIAAGNTSPPESIAAFINGGWLTAPTIATPTPTPTPTPTGTAVAYPYYPSSAVPNLPSDVTAKKGDPTVFNRTTLGGATGTQVSGSPTFTPYYTGVQTTVPTPQTAPVNFATKVDSAGVKGDVAVGSVDAAHIAAGGTFADLAAVKAIYDSGDVKKIADWEKFSGTSKPATAPQGGGMSPYSAGDPSTGSTMPAWAPPTTKFTQ